MKTLFANGMVYNSKGFEKRHFTVIGNRIHLVDEADFATFDNIVDCSNKYILPGLVDVHVHFREPGFLYKETIATGSKAAAHGGYTTVCTMPNLKPEPSTLDKLNVQRDIIKKDAIVRVIPYGTITSNQSGRGVLSDMEAMAPYVCAFSDDGKGIQADSLMEEAMNKAKSLGKMIVAHCEDETLVAKGAYINDGQYAKEHGIVGISKESEWKQIERDLKLVQKTGCPYHICHVSTKESVDLIREAKKHSINVSAETAPHYLLLNETDLKDLGCFKMNPPLRGIEDQKALIVGIKDGTIDVIATDHAPHSDEEKARGLKDSPFGIVGLEAAFPTLYTDLVLKQVITFEELIKLMAIKPRQRFNLPEVYIDENYIADFIIVDLEKQFEINSQDFESQGHSTPFDHKLVQGLVEQTYVDGKLVFKI